MLFELKVIFRLHVVISFECIFTNVASSISSEECEKSIRWLEDSENPNIRSPSDGKSPSTCSHFRVVGGREALSKEFPHMALIAYDRWATKFLCAGTIISEYYILSAAHCQSTPKWGTAKWALVGDTDLTSGRDDSMPTLFRIDSIIPHPEFSEPLFYNDILLFKLERRIVFSSYIRPICLNSEKKVQDKHVVATGWGRVAQGSKQSKKLMKVRLTLVNGSECHEYYNPLKFKDELPLGINSQTMICAGSTNEGHDTCKGDSGGPLQALLKHHPCIFSQIGITSFGRTCGDTNLPGVYTRISYFIPWIEKIVWP